MTNSHLLLGLLTLFNKFAWPTGTQRELRAELQVQVHAHAYKDVRTEDCMTAVAVDS